MIWYTEVFSDRMLIDLLLLLISKSTNSQEIFGKGYNNPNASINTGTLDAKGLFWGSNDGESGVKIFGIENWWGCKWHRIAGWVCDSGLQKVKMTYGQLDSSTTNGYNTDGSGYISLSDATPGGNPGGYIDTMAFTPYGLLPTWATGSSSTYYSDGLSFDNHKLGYACVGGRAGNGYSMGMFDADLSDVFNTSDNNIAASISCKPLASTP